MINLSSNKINKKGASLFGGGGGRESSFFIMFTMPGDLDEVIGIAWGLIYSFRYQRDPICFSY